MRRINHPVLIGVGQITHREKIRDEGIDGNDLAAQAIEACAQDTGRSDILQHVDVLSVVSSFAGHRGSPLAAICEKAGINPAISEEAAVGGNNPQWLVNRAADKIMAGEFKVALLVGAEALYRNLKFHKLIDWEKLNERFGNDPAIVGDLRRGVNAHEVMHGVDRASHIYPLLENALRAHLKMSPTEYRSFLHTYYQSMAAAAEGNPYAWFNDKKKWDDITKPTRTNPLFNFPYTKYMNPVPAVNQAAAVLMTDTETARKLAIPRDKWVYIRGGAEATDKWYISERVNYYSSPLIRFTAKAALKSAGIELPDIDFFDLYSCFPCATIISALEIGLPIQPLPPLSITGGLSFFGGPGNNYTMHSIAHAVERLRKHPKEYGFITGVGHYLTKHSVGIYSGMEPEKAWGREPQKDIQARIDALESPVLCERPEGPATVETYTVLHDSPDGIPWPIIIARLDSGERCLATTLKGSDLVMQMEQEEFIGYRGHITPGERGPNIFR
jgi:acetyl-CoA C-acetyltransferase